MLSFGHTAQAVQRRRRYDLHGVACLVLGADGAACPASGRVYRALCGLPCCLLRVVVPGALEWAGVHRRGIQGTPGVGVGR